MVEFIMASDTLEKKTLQVSSSSFSQGNLIPKKYGYNSQNISPQLSWSKGPEGTKSYVVICLDPDAPGKEPWVHWVVYNIPAIVTLLPEAIPNEAIYKSMQQGYNDYKQIGWGGPNPPSGIHRYYFEVYAIDSILSELKNKIVTKAQLLQVMLQHHTLAKGSCMGTYAASSK